MILQDNTKAIRDWNKIVVNKPFRTFGVIKKINVFVLDLVVETVEGEQYCLKDNSKMFHPKGVYLSEFFEDEDVHLYIENEFNDTLIYSGKGQFIKDGYIHNS